MTKIQTEILNDIKNNAGKWITDSRHGMYYLIGCIDLIDEIYTISLNKSGNVELNTCLDNYTVSDNKLDVPKFDIDNIKNKLNNTLHNDLKRTLDIYKDYYTEQEKIDLIKTYSSLDTNPCFYLINE